MRILAVDDQVDMLLLLQRMLLQTEHQVTFAQDSRNALTIAEYQDFDVCIVDLRMPMVSGLELIQKIRKANPDRRIIAITGEERDRTNMDIVGPQGADAILFKPFSKTDLLTALAA